MIRATFRWLACPENWTFLFVFLCLLLFASAEIIMIGMFVAGVLWFIRHGFSLVPLAAKRSYFTLSLIFASVFIFKLLSALWAYDPADAVDNAFNNIHYLFWPGVALYMARTPLNPRSVEAWLAAVLFSLCGWYLIAVWYFPHLEDAYCFKAGGGNCGLLGTPLAFFLTWIFVALTSSGRSVVHRLVLVLAFAAGWIALIGTQRRTELIGMVVAIVCVVVWRSRQRMTKHVLAGLVVGFALFAVVAAVAMAPRWKAIGSEVMLYQQGGDMRDVAVRSTSIGQRLEMYRIALTAIADRPLLGWGAGIKPRHLARYAHDPLAPYHYSNFHQQYLQVLLELGVVGALIAVAGLLYLVYELVLRPWKVGETEIAVLAAALLFTLLWKGLANGVIGYSLFNVITVVFTAWFWAWSVRPKFEYNVERES